MSTSIEQQLRDMFAEDAARAPRLVGLSNDVVRRARGRRRRIIAAAAVVAVAASAFTATLVGRTLAPPAASPAPTASSTQRARTGALPGDYTSCVVGYSPAALREWAAFAFDGTVMTIGKARTNRSTGVTLPLVSVTFRVHEWFFGGSGDSISVDMARPHEPNTFVEDAFDTYGIGTRLLVSGAPRWGGAPLEDGIAWGCGFIRYYDAETAGLWRQTSSK